MTVVYLNGAYVPRGEAKLDIEDRGAMFADGVYEVVHYFGGRAFAMDQHVQRLQRSMAAIELAAPPADQFAAISNELVRRNNLDDATVYWQVTRGSAKRNHAIPADATPTVLAIAYANGPFDFDAGPAGVTATLVADLRWHRCAIKSLMLLANVLAKSQAQRAGAYEAILHRGDLITEGSSTNVLVVLDGQVHTHPANDMILGGITRDIVLHLARDNGLVCSEKAATVAQLMAAEEIMLTGTTTLVAAVTHVDQTPIAGGNVGPVTSKLHGLLVDHIAAACGLAR